MYHLVFFMYIHKNRVKMVETRKKEKKFAGAFGIRTHDLHMTRSIDKIIVELTVWDSTQ